LEVLGHPLLAVAFGVLLALGAVTFSTENPARIPLQRIILRALPGLSLFFVIWVVLSFLIASIVSNIPKVPQFQGVGRWISFASVGLATPLLVRQIKNSWFGRRTTTLLLFLLIILQIIDEKTALFLGKVISEEERKADFAALKNDDDRAAHAIDKLFEFHLVGITQDIAHRSPDKAPKRVLDLFKVHNVHVKFKLLLRYLGYEDCLNAIQIVAETPGIILRSWPEGQADRRRGHDRRVNPKAEPGQRKLPYGRRKSDSPYVHSFVLGEIGEQFPQETSKLQDLAKKSDMQLESQSTKRGKTVRRTKAQD
jgi:hypothetical protein